MQSKNMLDESEKDRRLEIVETKLMEIENTVAELNAVIIKQYDEIERLHLMQERLATRFAEINSHAEADPANEPPPPHY